MEKRREKALGILGSTAACMVFMAVPAYAQEQEQGSSETNENPADSVLVSSAWEDRAAANVENYAYIREEAEEEAAEAGVLPRGAAAKVLEKGEAWTKVEAGAITGYIRNDLLVYGEEAKNLYQEVHGISGTVEASSLRLREEPSLESRQIGAVPQGTKIRLLGRDGEWFQVQIDDADAYMFAEYITEDDLEATGMTEEEYLQKQQEAAREEEEKAVQAASGAVSVSGSDLDLLAAIIQCEAGGESHTGKVAVGAVIMNRIRDSRFPDSISEVVYQSGQFSPVASGALSRVLSQGAREDCYAAAREVLGGSNPVGTSLYFNSGRGKGIQIGNQHFY